MNKQFNFVYVTINLVNNKMYIGDHSTNNINDYYLGSGRTFLKAIKKYGRNNFIRIILEEFNTKEEAFNVQEKYIKLLNTLSPNGYNISPKGGLRVKGCHSKETKHKQSKWQKGKTWEEIYGKEKADIMKEKSRKGRINKPSPVKGKTLKSIWIKKYGKEKGSEKYDLYINK